MRDEISWICPYKKDYVNVKLENGARTKVQKCLLLSKLKENYVYFKKEHHDRKRVSAFC